MTQPSNFYRKDDFKRVRTTHYLREDILSLLHKFSMDYKLSKSDITEIALLQLFKKENWLIDWDIDINNYIETLQYEILRKFVRKQKSHLLSKVFFTRRLRTTLLKMILQNTSKKDILNYIDLCYKEAKLYSENKELMQEMNKYRTVCNDRYEDMKKLIKENIKRGELINIEIGEEKQMIRIYESIKNGNGTTIKE